MTMTSAMAVTLYDPCLSNTAEGLREELEHVRLCLGFALSWEEPWGTLTAAVSPAGVRSERLQYGLGICSKVVLRHGGQLACRPNTRGRLGPLRVQRRLSLRTEG